MYLYIMSRPHSGSTILDILLGSSDSVASCGEIIMGMERGMETWTCSCGEILADCPVWKTVRQRIVEDPGTDWDELVEASVRQGHKTHLPSTFLASPSGTGERDRFHQRLRDGTMKLAGAIRSVTGRKVVLDSSKLPSRGLFALKFLPDARLIHIIRDPRNVLASHYWRFHIGDTYLAQRRPWRGPLAPLAFVEAALMWFFGNLLFEIIGRIDPKRVVHIRYEDLRDDPASVIRRLSRELGLDFEDVIERIDRGETFDTGHMMGGNPVRTEGKVAFDPGKEKARERPAFLSWIAIGVCWPLMLRYGYSLRSDRRAGNSAKKTA